MRRWILDFLCRCFCGVPAPKTASELLKLPRSERQTYLANATKVYMEALKAKEENSFESD